MTFPDDIGLQLLLILPHGNEISPKMFRAASDMTVKTLHPVLCTTMINGSSTYQCCHSSMLLQSSFLYCLFFIQ